MQRKLTKREVALKYGFKSGLEERNAQLLNRLGIPFEYETKRIKYAVNRNATYRPDFILENGIIVETKGRFQVQDRMKHLMIREQHPDIDLRFVFSNFNNKISKGSNTSYKDWCIRYDFQYAQGDIPTEWLKEEPCPVRIAALMEAIK
jgi:hypothetical protein